MSDERCFARCGKTVVIGCRNVNQMAAIASIRLLMLRVIFKRWLAATPVDDLIHHCASEHHLERYQQGDREEQARYQLANNKVMR